jgi:2-methylisocitrate lyase-like PEP mutase family enzyme
MELSKKATRFAELHVKGDPLRLYNAWDAGSARAILDAGAASVRPQF